MAEVPRQSGGKESPISDRCNFRGVEPPAVKGSTSDGAMDSPTGRRRFADISLSMDDACDALPPSSPKVQVQSSFPHKGWFLGERKAKQQDDGCSKSHKGCPVDEKCQSVVVPISAMAEQTVMGERRMKRSRFPWLDSRKVFMIFASLSSMGTIMLIYLTLSMGRINGHHAQD